MARAPIQVAVFPFRRTADGFRYAVFRRLDAHYWQPVAGGAVNAEEPLQAAKRETLEEAGIPLSARYRVLETRTYVRADNFKDWNTWPADLYVVPQYYFAVEYEGPIVLSHEHTEWRWVTCDEAIALLHWDSDRTAVWELEQRLRRQDLRGHDPLHTWPG